MKKLDILPPIPIIYTVEDEDEEDKKEEEKKKEEIKERKNNIEDNPSFRTISIPILAAVNIAYSKKSLLIITFLDKDNLLTLSYKEQRE